MQGSPNPDIGVSQADHALHNGCMVLLQGLELPCMYMCTCVHVYMCIRLHVYMCLCK